RIREVVSIGRGAKDAFDRVVEQAVVPPLGFVQGLLGLLALRDVLYDAFEREDLTVVAPYAYAALPDPANLPVRMLNSILDFETTAHGKRRVDGIANAYAVLGMSKLFVGK